jgi:hypothetical protein
MLEDPARHERVGEGGDAVAVAAARGAAQHVHREGPLEELGPALALCLGARVGFGHADAWPGGGDGAAGDDSIAQGRGGGEAAEVGPLVLARVGDQGDEGGVVRDSCYDSVLTIFSPSTTPHGPLLHQVAAWIAYPPVPSPRDGNLYPNQYTTSVFAGETWYFQCWYRDQASGEGQSNFAEAIAIAFQ